MKLDSHDILIRPFLTEKITGLRETQNKVCFLVSPSANKIQIKQAAEEVLKVKIDKVHVLNAVRKQKRMGRFVGKRIEYKKAILTLKEGEKLELFEGV